MSNMIDFHNFPSTRYQGSKRKILPWIYEVFKDLKFDTALDGCGGTGSVSYLLKKMGKSVTYNDKLHFNYLIGKAIIENSNCILTPEDTMNLLSKNPNLHYPKLIESNFKGIYFLDKENIWLDKVVSNIDNLTGYKSSILEYKKAMAYYSLFQASMIKRPFNLFHRSNLKIRTNDVVRNFGNKSTWEKSFVEFFKQFANEANSLVFNSGRSCSATNKSIFDIDPVGYDLIYLDPPYIRKDSSNESSDYLHCYHFLEGISQYNRWDELIDFNSINHRFKNIKSQNDFSRQNIHSSFEELISKFRRSIIVFSYKKGGLPSIDFIIKTMKKNGKKVRTKSVHYKYALNHQNGDAKNNREVLIIGSND